MVYYCQLPGPFTRPLMRVSRSAHMRYCPVKSYVGRITSLKTGNNNVTMSGRSRFQRRSIAEKPFIVFSRPRCARRLLSDFGPLKKHTALQIALLTLLYSTSNSQVKLHCSRLRLVQLDAGPHQGSGSDQCLGLGFGSVSRVRICVSCVVLGFGSMSLVRIHVSGRGLRAPVARTPSHPRQHARTDPPHPPASRAGTGSGRGSA